MKRLSGLLVAVMLMFVGCNRAETPAPAPQQPAPQQSDAGTPPAASPAPQQPEPEQAPDAGSTPSGGVVDDVTVYKFNDEHFMIVTSSGPRKKTARWIADHAIGTSTYVADISAAIALPVVQGPRSRDFLKSIARNVDLDALKFFRFVPARIDETDLIISRSGYTGEVGFELFTYQDVAGELWADLVTGS